MPRTVRPSAAGGGVNLILIPPPGSYTFGP